MGSHVSESLQQIFLKLHSSTKFGTINRFMEMNFRLNEKHKKSQFCATSSKRSAEQRNDARFCACVNLVQNTSSLLAKNGHTINLTPLSLALFALMFPAWKSCYGLPVRLPYTVITCARIDSIKRVCSEPPRCPGAFLDLLSIHDKSLGNLHLTLHFCSSIENFSASCNTSRGTMILPPRKPSVVARLARWQ